MNWLKTEFYDLAPKGLPEYKVIQYRSIDSPYFPPEEWARAKRDMPPNVFERKYGGSFTRLEGLIFEDFSSNSMIIPLPSVPRAWQRIGGIDAGHSASHPFAVSIWASPNFTDPKCKIFKVGEFKGSWRLLKDIKQIIINMESAYCGAVPLWYMDPSAAQEIAELKSMGLNVRGAINDVEWGLGEVIAHMRNGRYRLVKDRTQQTVDELLTYARDESDNIIKENDHLMDADRYALATHIGRPIRRMEIH